MGQAAPVSTVARYGPAALPAPARRVLPQVPAELGLVVEDAETGWCGAVVAVERSAGMVVVVLEDRHHRRRSFPLGPGFLLEGNPVVLVRPQASGAPGTDQAGRGAGQRRTASGSLAVADRRARVARTGRIYVEGRHDAELVEKVWGEDLRVAGVVVEPLDGVDELPAIVAAFRPGPGRRLGVLVDHLVAGSKESRIAAQVGAGPGGEHVLVRGHPFVDIWAAVLPDRLGLAEWPRVPREQPWKEGVLAALGWPHADPADLAAGWRRILAAVHGYADLHPALSGRVEELVDFVTGDPLDT